MGSNYTTYNHFHLYQFFRTRCPDSLLWDKKWKRCGDNKFDWNDEILYEILLVKITVAEFLPLLSSFSTSTRRNLVEELLKAIASRSTARNMKQLLIAWKRVKIYTPSTKKFTKYWCNNHLRDSVYFISLNKDTKRMS